MAVKGHVLAAEDSPTQAAVLQGILEEAGFAVSLARNGAAALEMFESGSFDLVISDIVMPEMDGYDLCRAVKERDPQTPVVLLTSLTDPLDVVNALAAGADNFLRKPFSPEELVHRTRTMLYNKELRSSGRAQMGLELFFLGRRFMINADREQILDLLVSTFEDLVATNRQVRAREEELSRAHQELMVQLAETELERQRLHGVLAALPASMAITDASGNIVEANENLAELFRTPASELRGRPAAEAARFVDHAGSPVPSDQLALPRSVREGVPTVLGTGFDLFLDHPDGTKTAVIAHAAPIVNAEGKVVGGVGMVEDIAALLDHDPVTGLPGHGVLVDRLCGAIEASSAHATTTGLVVLAIDRYERIRASLPPADAERVVAVVATRLRGALCSVEVRQRSTMAMAAYLGNGEIAVIASDLGGEVDAIVLAELLAEQLAGPLDVGSTEVSVSVSAAVTVARPGTDPAALVSGVAAAARQAGADGTARVITSDETLHTAVVERLRMESELRAALETDQIVLHYQPQVRLRGGDVAAMEALVRWEHPHRGLLGAVDVIPLAVESGLIVPLGWAVLEKACRQAAQWRRELPYGAQVMMSVNVAAEQLAQPDVADRVARVLEDSGLDAESLVLEITEGSVMGDPVAVGTRLRAIRDLGVHVAVDDFGTGYSSLLQLRTFPVDILKIDRQFVAGMLDEPADAAIVAGTLRLARALGMEVVAEGVETLEQLVQLRVLGCDIGQGYHWAKPLPPEELVTWWAEHGGTAEAASQLPAPPVVDDDADADDAIAFLVHELRTPLTAVMGFADLLNEAPTTDAAPGFAQAILRNAHELESRLAVVSEARDVLNGGLVLHFEERNIADLVRTLAEDVAAQLSSRSVELHITDHETTAFVDPGRITQAVTNLLTNAARFSPPDTAIAITVGVENGKVAIKVRDHGPGVPEHRRHELFRRFSRLGARSKGMGIGLYLSRLIVDAHGGTLSYDPARGGGAVFSICLPATNESSVGGGRVEGARTTDEQRCGTARKGSPAAIL